MHHVLKYTNVKLSRQNIITQFTKRINLSSKRTINRLKRVSTDKDNIIEDTKLTVIIFLITQPTLPAGCYDNKVFNTILQPNKRVLH